jgi:hypothetical protein
MKATDFNLKKFYLKEDLKEGWSKLPNIDREKYQPRDGLEGPIMTRSGKVVYYDNVEGKYYDPDTDMYLTYDQWKAFDPELPIKESEQSDVKVILDKHNITSVDDIEYGSKAYEELFSYYMDSGEMPYGTMKARDGDPDQWIADRVSDLGLIREDAGDDGYSWNCKKCGTANEFRMTPQEQQEYIDDWEKDNQDLVADGETGESALDWVLTTIGQESEMHIGSKCKKCGTVAVDTVVGEKADNSTDLMKQYKDNEHNNYHSENNLLLAKAFGTPKEVKMVELVLAKNKKQGYTDTMDSEWMYHNIHKKYYPELVKGKLKEVYGSIGEEASDQGFSGKEKNFIHDLCMMHDGVKRDPAGLKYLGTSETWNEGNVLSDKGKLTTLMLWVKKNKDAVEKRFSRKFGNYSNRDENGKVTASDGNQMLNDIINKIGSIGEDGSSHTSMNKYGLSARNHKGKFYSYRHGEMTGVFDSMEELAKHQEELIKNESNTSIFDESWDEGCECCGCETQKECTCEPDCPNCNCHSGVKEADNPEHGSTEYYRNLDKGQLNHTKSMLMKTAGQLNIAIEQRYKFSKELMGNTGDRAGTGDLQKMLDSLNNIIAEWDEETKLYGK